ncbi:hypothetical protein GCM10011416_06740 [Polaribacter pacificus]|uniref:DUF5689 domain-containing protein n=1 Tax=Polaribacter pacificus TaxID=1775173 RepID=A0A917HVL4_9FLAO|nr:DUF5689 domain-containing protein [Polaribacter pacificus]GGG92456.1 hypothetical protein GCM10011416_06740 [Polaribacter pacificus]
MKTYIQFLRTFLILNLILSCSPFHKFDLPDLLIEEPNIEANTNISMIKNALNQAYASNQDLLYTFPIYESPLYAEAYVVSTDATGNFYKKLIVQDKAANPEAGIAILLNDPSLNELFEIGRKLYIKLDGLSVSYDDGETSPDPSNSSPGIYTLGFVERSDLVAIPSSLIKEHLIKSTEWQSLEPQIVDVKAITEAQLNTFVRFEQQQFEKNQLEKSFAGEINDEFDGFRLLRDCKTGTNIRLKTSTFASFKSVMLPQGRGSVDGILSKDYTGKFLVMILNSPEALSFTDADRCDPNYLACEKAEVNRSTILLYQDFENISNNESLLAAGWSNINSNKASTVFKPKTTNGNRFMELSAYDSGENPLEVWLISPPVSLAANNQALLSFETNTGYDNGTALRVFVSTDFTGDPAKAQWTPLDAFLSEGPSAGYSAKFTKSGEISLSCLTGDFYLGFQYLGADGIVSTTVQIDKVKIIDK